jgi:hypothetical protein
VNGDGQDGVGTIEIPAIRIAGGLREQRQPGGDSGLLRFRSDRVARPIDQPPYIRARRHGVWADDLLTLPIF